MSDGVTVTVTWEIKPERTEEFIKSLGGMFSETAHHFGFRSIRLVRSESAPNSFLLIEEWDETQNFQDYGKFRQETGDTGRLLEMTAGFPQVGIWSSSSLAEAKA